LFVLSALALPSAAAAQSQEATDACLLLRPAADCLSTVVQPFSSPGDSMSLSIWRPSMPPSVKARTEATYISGEIAADIVLEKDRQVISVPLTWSPSSLFSAGAVVPLVHQSLKSGEQFTIGDIALTLGTAFPAGDIHLRGMAAVKVPTGDPDTGTGSGAVDVMGFTDAWYYLGDLGIVASAGYRYNGRDSYAGLAQESIGAEYNLDAGTVGVAIGGRFFLHQVFEDELRTTTHAVLSVQPRITSVALGYVGLFIPIGSGEDFGKGLVLSAGFSAPFGRSPARPREAVAPDPIAPPRAATPTSPAQQQPPSAAASTAPVTTASVAKITPAVVAPPPLATTPPVATAPPPALPPLPASAQRSSEMLGARLLANPEGLLIFALTPAGAGERAGLGIGDKIRAAEGFAVATESELDRALASRKGALVKLQVSGPAGERTIEVPLPMPAMTTTATSADDLR
jgi:hypothetical protein